MIVYDGTDPADGDVDIGMVVALSTGYRVPLTAFGVTPVGAINVSTTNRDGNIMKTRIGGNVFNGVLTPPNVLRCHGMFGAMGRGHQYNKTVATVQFIGVAVSARTCFIHTHGIPGLNGKFGRDTSHGVD